MSYQRNNYQRSNSGNYQKKRDVNTLVLFALVGIFFVALMYEVTSNGVTTFIGWLPGVDEANFAGDTVVNIIQIVIFSFVAALTGTPYSGSQLKSGQYRKKSNEVDHEYSAISEDQKRRVRDTERYNRQMKKENRKSYRKNKR